MLTKYLETKILNTSRNRIFNRLLRQKVLKAQLSFSSLLNAVSSDQVRGSRHCAQAFQKNDSSFPFKSCLATSASAEPPYCLWVVSYEDRDHRGLADMPSKFLASQLSFLALPSRLCWRKKGSTSTARVLLIGTTSPQCMGGTFSFWHIYAVVS